LIDLFQGLRQIPGLVPDWFWNATGSTAAPKQVCQTDFGLKRFAYSIS